MTTITRPEALKGLLAFSALPPAVLLYPSDAPADKAL